MFSQLRQWIERKSAGKNGLKGAPRFAPRNRVAAASLLLFALGLLAPLVTAQGLDPAALLKPATDTWPTYNGDYSGKRFSPLEQINAGNVGSLTLAWAFRPHASSIKATPLVVNGILYFTAPDNVWAVDARFGHEI